MRPLVITGEVARKAICRYVPNTTSDLICSILDRINVVGDCWIWSGWNNEDGYGKIRINKKAYFVHRVIYSYFFGEIPLEKPCVLHKCDTPSCLNPNHLFVGTHAENMKDMKNKGRARSGRKPGQDWPTKKLDESKILLIREDKRSQREIAKDYGVSQQLISEIKRKIRWSHA